MKAVPASADLHPPEPRLVVHLTRKPADQDLAALRQLLHPGVILTTGDEPPPQADYQILVSGRPTPQALEASPHLHTLIIPFAGIPNETRQILQRYPHLRVHNLHHNAAATAELALALLLAAAKRIPPVDRALRAGDWTARYAPPADFLLEGKTALILGCGQIGQRVARACLALGMRVLAIRRHPQRTLPKDLPIQCHPPSRLASFLPQTQALVITLPLTSATLGLIGAKELNLMPRGALLVNVGRGAVVDQAALYHALRQRQLGAAGLDVWYNYPQDAAGQTNTPPSDYPFGDLDNVVLSPHRGGGTTENERLRMQHLAQLLNLALQGQALPNRVDLKAGY